MILEALIDWFFIGFVEKVSKGRPAWVWLLAILSPLILLALLGGALYLLLV